MKMPKVGDEIVFERPEGSLFSRSTVILVPFPDQANEDRAIDAWAKLLLPFVIAEVEGTDSQAGKGSKT